MHCEMGLHLPATPLPGAHHKVGLHRYEMYRLQADYCIIIITEDIYQHNALLSHALTIVMALSRDSLCNIYLLKLSYFQVITTC